MSELVQNAENHELSDAFEKLGQEAARLQSLIDTVPSFLRTSFPDGSKEFLNRRWYEYTGLTPEQGKGWGWKVVVHPDDLDRLLREWLALLNDPKPGELETRIRRYDGEYRWFLIRVLPEFDAEGNVVRWLGSDTDIEDRKRAETKLLKDEQELRRITDAIPHTIVVLDPKGNALYANQAMLDYTGLTMQDVLASDFRARTFHPEDLERVGEEREGGFAGGLPFEIELRVLRKDGQYHWLLLRYNPLRDEKGSFTGSTQRRLGRFESADGGTIFLDEVGDLPSETQVALLRVLQEREFERVGGTQSVSVDVRVIAATNRDLTSAVAEGEFRQDLFYRLNVFPIRLPALRERISDISLLVGYLIDRYAKTLGKKIRNIDKKTIELFHSYDWPGNIRELQNVVERAVILCEGETFFVDETWLTHVTPKLAATTAPLVADLVEHEREILEAALRESEGVVGGPTGAAVKLGIPRQTLESKIRG